METRFSQSRPIFAANRQPLTSLDWFASSGPKDCLWDGVAMVSAAWRNWSSER